MRFQDYRNLLAYLQTLEEAILCLQDIEGEPRAELLLDTKKLMALLGKRLKPILPPQLAVHWAAIPPLVGQIRPGAPQDLAAQAAAHLAPVREWVVGQDHPLRVAFYPYKAAMWSALESVWRAFSKDPRFEVEVVVPPHVVLGKDRQVVERVCEADLFPKEVGAKPGNRQSVAVSKPDVVFISNPYDGTNTVTQLIPEYHSAELRAHTSLLVYVPYYLTLTYSGHRETFYTLPAFENMDIIVAQSQLHRRLFIKHGVDPDKLIALGSPKVDAVLAGQANPPAVPEDWARLCRGKRVILWNTRILKLAEEGANSLREMETVLRICQAYPECVLLWRPHPLSEAAVETHANDLLEEYRRFVERFCSLPNVIYDDTPSYETALHFADALVSEYSSILAEFMATGKPALYMRHEKLDKAILLFPILDNYLPDDSGHALERFVQMVIAGADPMKAERQAAMRGAVAHSDGSCGEAILRHVAGIFFS